MNKDEESEALFIKKIYNNENEYQYQCKLEWIGMIKKGLNVLYIWLKVT